MQKVFSEFSFSIVVADSQPFYSQGLASILKSFTTTKNLHEVNDGFELLKYLHHNQVDVVFLDTLITFVSAKDCIQIIKSQFPGIKIVAITQTGDEFSVFSLPCNDLHGILSRNCDDAKLAVLMNTLLSGTKYFDPIFSGEFFLQHLNSSGMGGRSKLTKREREILKLITFGRLSKEIAHDLCMSEDTVKKHRRNILIKIKGKSIADAIHYSIKNHVVDFKAWLKYRQDQD